MSETIDRPESGAVVTIPTLMPSTMFAPGGIDKLLAELERAVLAQPADISTEKGRKKMRSVAYQIARSKTAIDGAGKELKDEYRKKGDAIDVERRKGREFCDALAERYLSPLTAWETKEADRIKGHEDALAAMQYLFDALDPEPTPRHIQESLDKLDAHEDGREWQEFSQRANDLHAEIGLKLTNALAYVLDREEAAAEAERLRLEAEEAARIEAARIQREREKRIAVEAADKARKEEELRSAQAAAAERQRVEQEKKDEEDTRLEAEKAAQAEIEALEELNRIAQDRARQAEERAAAAAEKAEADRVAAAAKAESDRIAAIEAERARVAGEKAAEEEAAAQRAKNLEIKRKVNFDAAASLVVRAGLTEQQAQRVVIAIAKREIPAVEIRY